MGNRDNAHLSNDASTKEIREWLDNHTDQDITFVDKQTKKKMNATERGRVRRNIEEIKEERRLSKLLDDDYGLLDS